MGKDPVMVEELETEEDFEESDILFDDEKYMKGRRDSKSSKTKNARRPRDRRNSSGNSEMETLAQKQPVEEFHVTEVKTRRQSSTASDEVDIDAELATLVKDMGIKPKDSEVVELPKNVYYYGWFLSPTASDSLTKFSESSLKECLEVAQFLRWIDSTGKHGIEKGARDVTSYYQHSRKSLLHVTAKFCGRVESVPYAAEVHPHVGSEFNLAIVGFYFTEKTFGLRVKLSDEQWKMFDNERGRCLARRNSAQLNSVDPPPVQEGKITKSVASAGSVEKRRSKTYPGLSFVTQRENFQPTDTRAHITIGTVPKVKAKQAGEDLLDIVDMELRSTTPFHDYKVPSGTLRQFGRHGDYVFVLYPKSRIYVKGVFLPVV